MSVSETTPPTFEDRATRAEAKVLAFTDIRNLKAVQRCAEAEVGGLAWPTIALSTSAILVFAAFSALTTPNGSNEKRLYENIVEIPHYDS